MNEYLRSFVIGSSWLSFIIFFIKVSNLSNNIKNYKYETYTILAPIYLGMMNMLSLYIQKKYNLSLRNRLIIISIISSLCIIIMVKLFKLYNYNENEYLAYTIRIFMNHFLIYNVIIYFIEDNI
jgi:hypothetical protein